VRGAPYPAPSSLVGREQDLAALGALFDGGARTVSVVGPPGIGKTRLAIEHAGGARGPAWFVDLSEAVDLAGIVSAVAAALGLSPQTDATGTLSAIGAALAERGAALLVLDNFEQVVSFAEQTVVAWRALAPELRLLVTSRERLRVRGERLFPLGPLERPAATRLFVERALSARGDADLPDAEMARVDEIIGALGGNALAIELAAARMRVLGAAQIAARLDSPLDLLADARRPVARQASLRAAIDASWRALDPHEAEALARCSVFRGGFDLSAAEAVVESESGPAIDLLSSLCDRSLLRTGPTPGFGGERRFAMDLPIREFAAERLAESADAPLAAERFARFFLEHARAQAARADGPAASEARARLALELENHVAAFERSAADGNAARALQISTALDPLLYDRGPLDTHVDRLGRALGLLGTAAEQRLRARALRARGDALRVLGRTAEATADLEAARSLATQIGDPETVVRSLRGLARTRADTGALQEALRDCREAVDRCRAAGLRLLEGQLRMLEGAMLVRTLPTARLGEARDAFEDALRIHRETGDGIYEAITLGDLASVEIDEGHLGAARDLLAEALEIHRRGENARAAGITLGQIARIDLEEGRAETALDRLGEALHTLRAVGERRAERFYLFHLGRAEQSLGRLEVARATYRRALEMQREAGSAVHQAILRAHLAWLESERAQPRAADREIASAAALIGDPPSPHFGAIVSLCRALVVRARDPSAARRILEDVARGEDQCQDVRVLRRSLEAALGIASEEPDAVVVDRAGRWFRAPRGPRVDLPRRRALRLLLSRLAEARLDAPDRALGVDEVFAAGWPGERAHPESVTSRVYVAIATLRKLGLRSVLLRRDDGYLLDPRIALRRE